MPERLGAVGTDLVGRIGADIARRQARVSPRNKVRCDHRLGLGDMVGRKWPATRMHRHWLPLVPPMLVPAECRQCKDGQVKANALHDTPQNLTARE